MCGFTRVSWLSLSEVSICSTVVEGSEFSSKRKSFLEPVSLSSYFLGCTMSSFAEEKSWFVTTVYQTFCVLPNLCLLEVDQIF